MTEKEYEFIPSGTWVKCISNGILRFVTKANKSSFEDDGKISGQSPAPLCHYKYYRPLNYQELTQLAITVSGNYIGEFQSKFKKVAMKENGEIVIDDQGGWQAEWDKKAEKLAQKDAKEYMDKFKDDCKVCPSCYGHTAFQNIIWCNKCKNRGIISKMETEKIFINPPERDWEIMSFKEIESGNIWRKNEDDSYSIKEFPGSKMSFDYFMGPTNKPKYIHSVRRKSDNSIWTVGDKVKAEYQINGTICFFGLEKNVITAYIRHEHTFKKQYPWALDEKKSIELSKLEKPYEPEKLKPLFTTNDGVEIYDGMKYFFVGLVLNYDPWNIQECNATISTQVPGLVTDGYIVTFSTRKAAEAYVKENKPVTFTFGYGGLNYEVKAKNQASADCFNTIFENSRKSPYDLLAQKLGLTEHKIHHNLWEDESGHYYYLTAYGFLPAKKQK